MADPTPAPVIPTPAPAPATPISGPDFLSLVETELKKIYTEFKADITDNSLSFSEIVSLVTELIGGVTAINNALGGANQIAVIEAAVLQFYNTEISPLGVKEFGSVIESTVIDPMMHLLIPRLIAAAQASAAKV